MMQLVARSLAAGYRRHLVCDGISFTVEPGKILTLIGPNGAGKSTILKTIAAQLPPLGGTVLLGDRVLHEMPEPAVARELSLFLTTRLHTELMTCRDVVESGRYPYTGRLGILSAHDHEVVEEAMALTHVTDLARQDFTCISDGQRQRVMLARAIAQEPSVLVLDEPTSYLDIRHKLELLTLIKQLVRERRTAVILSLHELELAERISDRLLCIRDGRIDRTGTPEEIFAGGYIASLYGMTQGSFNALYGVPELSPPAGLPEIFVLGGGGSGIPVYRRLQREGRPFAAGILPENDLDYPVARALAAQVISVPAFSTVDGAAVEKALAVMQQCSEVIVCCKAYGTVNAACKRLIEAAEQGGKLC
ncbi:MAG: ABC transporter ATP-binding protein [Oscillospiraceae bacterium]|nr:ABC transporter ATP-binding protein [Oscillospiraceae bacterium]